MATRHPLFIVDAFTDHPFHGNPAAVCLLRHDHPDTVLQSIGAEMNLAETAFVRPVGDDLFEAVEFHLRWFTPLREVPLCGHATLATAKVLWDEMGLPAGTLRFRTQSGELRAHATPTGITLDFPAIDTVKGTPGATLASILGVDHIAETRVAPGARLLLVRLDSPDAVRSAQPDFGRIRAEIPDQTTVVVTATGDAPVDFVSRCFAPALGIDEDPVTGMAHCVLGPYWASELGKPVLRAHQASRRGGDLEVDTRPSGRVHLGGRARVVLRGYIDLPS